MKNTFVLIFIIFVVLMHFVTALLTTGRNNVKSCDNGIKDDNEADVDCGDECFKLCEIGMKC